MMKHKKNILVFPCGSEIGLTIHDCLKYSTFFNLIGLSSVCDHGEYVFTDYIGDAPNIEDESFIQYIKDCVDENNIDAIYPAMDKVATILKRAENKIGCKIITSDLETSEICLSKEKTYDLLAGIVPIPQRYNPQDINSFPIFVKPKIGYGSRGAHLITSDDELQTLKNRNDLLFLEYLPGHEYTVDCFTDRHGVLRFCKARIRQRIRNGISVNTRYIADRDDILEMAHAINKNIKFNGAWFFQIKQDNNGSLKLLEIADRFGGSSVLAKGIGANLPLLTLFNAFEYDVDIELNTYNLTLDRALDNKFKIDIDYQTVYVDYDDTLLINKREINSELISFLYQCLNNNKKLILITKHQTDIIPELKQYRISELFDEVIQIQQEDNKIDYINDLNSIFIDDSYAERHRIKQAHGIPVFSPEMINILNK